MIRPVLHAVCAGMFALTVAGASMAKEAIPPAYVSIADEHGVPANLLYAIAKTESNAGFSGKPWPWTLNVRGAPLYFQTRKHAVDYLEQEIAAGEDRIAIGLMQIYWRYHGDAIGSVDLAIDPVFNVAYGASFLRSLFERHGDWAVATACYHHCDRKKPRLGDDYAQLVANRLGRIQP